MTDSVATQRCSASAICPRNHSHRPLPTQEPLPQLATTQRVRRVLSLCRPGVSLREVFIAALCSLASQSEPPAPPASRAPSGRSRPRYHGQATARITAAVAPRQSPRHHYRQRHPPPPISSPGLDEPPTQHPVPIIQHHRLPWTDGTRAPPPTPTPSHPHPNGRSRQQQAPPDADAVPTPDPQP